MSVSHSERGAIHFIPIVLLGAVIVSLLVIPPLLKKGVIRLQPKATSLREPGPTGIGCLSLGGSCTSDYDCCSEAMILRCVTTSEGEKMCAYVPTPTVPNSPSITGVIYISPTGYPRVYLSPTGDARALTPPPGSTGTPFYPSPTSPGSTPEVAVTPACGKRCVYSQRDTDGEIRCYQGNCLDGSQSCDFNINCGWVNNDTCTSSGAEVVCPGREEARPSQDESSSLDKLWQWLGSLGSQ